MPLLLVIKAPLHIKYTNFSLTNNYFQFELKHHSRLFCVAIEAMKNAHREELEKTQRSPMSSGSADIQELRRQYE